MSDTKINDYVSPIVREWLTPIPGRRAQSFEYYAAHFIIGSGLLCRDPEGTIRAWAYELKKHYDSGVEHGLRHPGDVSLRQQ